MKRLEGQVAVVTGAASGIGAACAQRFADEGAVVAGFDVQDPPDGHPLAGSWIVDVRDEAALADAVAEVVDQLGAPTLLVNAAGVTGLGAVHDLPQDEWDRVVDVNLKGTYLVTKHVVPHLLAAGHGAVVNVASIEGLEAMPDHAAYNASKGGVVLLTKSMAMDYAPQGVRVNCVCPGYIVTPMSAPLRQPGAERVEQRLVGMHPLGHAGQPEEVAAATLFLASDDASFVTGHALPVDGGFLAGHVLMR